MQVKHRLEKLTTNSSTWYYINPRTENTHLTPNTCPTTPHSQLINHLRRSTKITAVEVFNSFSLSKHNKLNDQVIFLLTNPSLRLVTNLLVAHVLMRESCRSTKTLYSNNGQLWTFAVLQKIYIRTREATFLQCRPFKVCKRCIRRNRQ